MDFRREADYFLTGKINEECGVFGVFNADEASSLSYFGLHALQHRGQEAAGLATSDGEKVICYKDFGLISEIFTPTALKKLTGTNAIGHVRYATQGANQIENIQPLMVRAHTGEFAIVHNGQIVNAPELKIQLENEGSIFQGTSDSEVLAHLIQKESGKMIDKIKKACLQLEGAFAFIVLTKDHLYAIRDKNGLRPLSLGQLVHGLCVSSETCAFDVVGAKFIRDVAPGEIVCIDHKEIKSYFYTECTQTRMCAMEYIYFARPDSVIEGINVHHARKQAGKILARQDDVGYADIVIGVPDSSLSAAIGYAEESGLPYELGLIKNRYVGRTFIQPTQKLREQGVRMKLSAVSSIVKGKRVLLIDDSIVRGTTSKRIVQLLKDAGALEVHVRIASPPIISPCFYGVDTSSFEELISASKNLKTLTQFIGADTLRFMSIEETIEANGKNCCLACFTQDYPTTIFSYNKIIQRGIQHD